jgi:hypothetical protein
VTSHLDFAIRLRDAIERVYAEFGPDVRQSDQQLSGRHRGHRHPAGGSRRPAGDRDDRMLAEKKGASVKAKTPCALKSGLRRLCPIQRAYR